MLTQYEASRVVIRIPAKDLGLSITEKSVFIALIDRLGVDNVCFPSQLLLAEQVGCSRKSVCLALKKLKALDWIDTKPRVVDGQKKGNYYTLNLPKLHQVTGSNVVQMTFRNLA